MGLADNWERIFNIDGEEAFQQTALQVFRYQAANNPVYARYMQLLGIEPEGITTVSSIPFLPIELFKTQDIIAQGHTPQLVFESSGTTGQQPSRHLVADAKVYQQSFFRMFRQSFGQPEEMCILALLPSYLERGNSSLVYMAQHLIQASTHPQSGFFLNDLDGLARILQQLSSSQQPTLLLGVSFALLDLAEQHPMPLGSNIRMMETGGMKGRRKELTRTELHQTLKDAFGVDRIYSEYGMTELLSQAYTDGSDLFTPAPWMRVLTRDPYDPLTLLPNGHNGGINVIDLANIYSCSFIATGDLGQVQPNGRFTILGRMDQAEVRGCNLMIE